MKSLLKKNCQNILFFFFYKNFLLNELLFITLNISHLKKKKKKKVMLPTITKGRGSNRLIKIIRCNRLTVRGIDLCETA